MQHYFGQKTSLNWAYSTGMVMEWLPRGLSMDMEFIGIVGAEEIGLGRFRKHPEKHL